MGSLQRAIARPSLAEAGAARKSRVLTRILDIAPRAIADLTLVHTAMLAAVAMVAFHARELAEPSLRLCLAGLRDYYLTLFCPLSFLFPVVHAITGLYTTARGYRVGFKLRRAAMSAGIAAMLLVFVSSVRGLPEVSVRVAVLAFSILAVLGTPGIRWLKHAVFANDNRRARAETGSGEAVLVVGGAGYIGSLLVRKLLRRGYRVRVLDSVVYGDQALREVFSHPRLDFIRGDCRNIQDVVGAIAGVRSVVHLAAIVGDPACDRDHKTAREINYAATRMMIEVAKGESAGRFIFASSCSVYGVSEHIVDENSDPKPISLYAETKLDSEQALLAAETDSFHPTILRFSTIFGLSPRPRFDLVVNLLTAKAKQEGIITIYNGRQWRPFLHVDDAAEAIIRVLEAPVAIVGGQVYNVGDDSLNYSLAAVGRQIQEIFPRTRVEHVDNADHRDYHVSFKKIRDQLGFRCARGLDDGIRELARALSDGLVSDYQDPVYSNLKFLQAHGSPAPGNRIAAQVMAALAQKV